MSIRGLPIRGRGASNNSWRTPMAMASYERRLAMAEEKYTKAQNISPQLTSKFMKLIYCMEELRNQKKM